MNIKDVPQTKTSILYFTRFSVQSFISELKVVISNDYGRTYGRTQWIIKTAALYKLYDIYNHEQRSNNMAF